MREGSQHSPNTLASEQQDKLACRMSEVCVNLKPFQSFEYDPAIGLVTICTELLVPSHDLERLWDVVTRRERGEKIAVKRFANSYKVALTKRIHLQY
jgi:hypothetical protein